MYSHRANPYHTDPHIRNTLEQAGFYNLCKISDTLQGSIWQGNKMDQISKVIKVTNKHLHRHSISNTTKPYKIRENILSEQSILHYLSKQSTLPRSIIKYDDAFESRQYYFLGMEHGGRSLFHFITKAHKLIARGTLDICEWRRVTKIIFKQMIESIAYLHSKNICHFDISLENVLINDVQIHETKDRDTRKTKIQFVCKHIQCKLCDFGLSERFEHDSFMSSKYCGKLNYCSPEINEKKRMFNAASNDIWCVAMCLFMMSLGISPWIKASKTDAVFMLIINGHLPQVLDVWNKTQYVDEEWIDLMRSLLQYEENRIGLKQIKDHSWFI